MHVQSAVSGLPTLDHLTRPRTPPPRPRRALLPLATLAACYTTVQLLLVLPDSGLGWDETIYVSQVGGDVPTAYFSAPRARGISYLVAPLAAVTTSATALRVYLALLSGAALLAVLWVWRRLLPVSVLAWGGALFAGLWVTVYYGPLAMPNLWCALGALAALGFFVRTARSRRREDPVAATGLAGAVAAVALLRPPDAFWLVAPMVLAALMLRGVRRGALLAALVGGALLGAAPWIAEAYVHYGGFLARVQRGSEIQGGMGWRLALWDHLRSLQGRVLCRPCDMRWREPQTAVWWCALPLLTAAGVVAAARAGRRRPAVLAAAVAVSMAVPYLLLMGYAAPRFLLPSYALLALPVAEGARACWARAIGAGALGVRRPCTAWSPRPYSGRPYNYGPYKGGWRVVGAALVTLLAAHLVVQYQVLETALERSRRLTRDLEATAAQLHRLGVRPPCMVTGEAAVPVAYYAGCASLQSEGNDASVGDAALRRRASREPTAVLTRRHGPPRWARDWPSVRTSLHGNRAWVKGEGGGAQGR
jgi:hypothetical protein